MTLSVLGTVIFRQLYCRECVQAEEERLNTAHQERKVDREAAWAAVCPCEYRLIAESDGKTDLARLQADCLKLAEILAWRDGKGLLLRGDTGACKTRAAWRVMRRQWEAGAEVWALTGGDFSRQYADACGRFTRHEWFQALAGVDLLLIDDLGKSEWTAGVWGEFFELVEARSKTGKPLIVTTNESGATLAKKSKDQTTFEPLQRRLREMTQIVLP